MKVSIVIPAYNEELYLPKTLDSIVKQSYQNFELIVVDCFSEDKTAKIAEGYGANVVQFYKGNIGAARRAGTLVATGDLIVSGSADTIYKEDWLENLIKPIIEKRAHATFGPVYLENLQPVEEKLIMAFNNVFIPSLTFLKIPYSVGDSMAFNKNFYFSIGGFKPMNTCEDLDILKRCFKHGKTVYVKNAIAYTSARRIREWGWPKFIAFHTKNFIKYNLFGMYSKNYAFLSTQTRALNIKN